MQLPNNSIGVSDIKGHDECARRFEFGMRRHIAGGESPEADNWTNAYGSAFHEAVSHAAKTGCTDDEAIQFAFESKYGRWLGPEEQVRLKLDMQTYRERDYVGVRLVAVEEDKRVPLFVTDDGVQIYYRFKVDRLYEQLGRPGSFIHVDYKTSRHPRSKAEVDEDEQMGSYQWALRELYPEIEDLVSLYDQLGFGRIPTRRSPEQLANVKEWLIRKTKAILSDDVLEPTYNQWCAYCPILFDCPIVPKLTNYALAEIAGLAPEVKEGRKTVINLDPEQMDVYVAQMEVVAGARRVLERFEERVKETMKGMPAERLGRLGYERRTTTVQEWEPDGLQRIIEDIGIERFTELVSLTKTAVEKLDPTIQEQVNRYLITRQGAPRLAKMKIEKVKK